MEPGDIRLKLVEAAAALPGVRLGSDYREQARRAMEVAEMWYNFINTVGVAKRVAPPRSRDKR